MNLEGIVITETMGAAIGIGVFVLVFIYLGCLMWKKEKITLLHSYHYDKVSPSDGIIDSALSFTAFALGFVVELKVYGSDRLIDLMSFGMFILGLLTLIVMMSQ